MPGTFSATFRRRPSGILGKALSGMPHRSGNHAVSDLAKCYTAGYVVLPEAASAPASASVIEHVARFVIDEGMLPLPVSNPRRGLWRHE
jgi:hypothetical protein